MGISIIGWTDYTWNPWEGCHKVSPGCKNCYAWRRDIRLHRGANWGPDAPRQLHGAKYMDQVRLWNDRAGKAGRIARVFCGSLCDILEPDYRVCPDCHRRIYQPWRDCKCGQYVGAVPYALGIAQRRAEAFAQVHYCPNLMFLFLTKRPENFNFFPPAWRGDWPTNAMFGFTAEDNKRLAERRDHWLKFTNIFGRVPTFVSAEPLLERLHWGRIGGGLIDWVIDGGESGGNARPADHNWFRSNRDQCEREGVPFFHKQNGQKGEGRSLDGRTHDGLPAYWPANVGLEDPLAVLA